MYYKGGHRFAELAPPAAAFATGAAGSVMLILNLQQLGERLRYLLPPKLSLDGRFLAAIRR